MHSILIDKPVLHVVFGMSAAGSIRQALRQIGCNERVIGFPDDLSVGPIDVPEARYRKDWLDDELSYPLEISSQSDQFWTDAMSPDVSPVAWVCRNHALEYAGFLEFVSRVGESAFWVTDASDVVIPRGMHRETALWSLGILTPDQIIKADLSSRRTRLSPPEVTRYRDLWQRLQAENARFRVVDHTGLRSAAVTHFDDAILSRVTSEWQKGARVVAEAMVELIERPFSKCAGDMVVWSRVLALADLGHIEIDGDGPGMRDHRVRLVAAPHGRVVAGPIRL